MGKLDRFIQQGELGEPGGAAGGGGGGKARLPFDVDTAIKVGLHAGHAAPAALLCMPCRLHAMPAVHAVLCLPVFMALLALLAAV